MWLPDRETEWQKERHSNSVRGTRKRALKPLRTLCIVRKSKTTPLFQRYFPEHLHLVQDNIYCVYLFIQNIFKKKKKLNREQASISQEIKHNIQKVLWNLLTPFLWNTLGVSTLTFSSVILRKLILTWLHSHKSLSADNVATFLRLFSNQTRSTVVRLNRRPKKRDIGCCFFCLWAGSLPPLVFSLYWVHWNSLTLSCQQKTFSVKSY